MEEWKGKVEKLWVRKYERKVGDERGVRRVRRVEGVGGVGELGGVVRVRDEEGVGCVR